MVYVHEYNVKLLYVGEQLSLTLDLQGVSILQPVSVFKWKLKIRKMCVDYECG